MEDFKYDFGVPLPLLNELKKRKALPLWWQTVSSKFDSDWLNNFHKAFTKEGYPVAVQKTEVGVIDTSLNPFAHLSDETDSIVFPALLVPIFYELVNCVFGYMQPPNSVDPNAKMFITNQGEKDSRKDLGVLLGRLKYTQCPSLIVENPFIPIVIATCHYIYCHELTHIALSRKFKEDGWTSRQEEFECDRMAFVMMTLTYRSYPDYQQAFSLLAPAVSFSLLLIRSYLFDGLNKINSTHPTPEERYIQLRKVSLRAEQNNMIASGGTELADSFWSYTNKLIKNLNSKNLLMQNNPVKDVLAILSANRQINSDESYHIVTNIIQWCSFGNQDMVKQSIKNVLDAISFSADKIVREKIRLFKEELKNQTADFDQILGLGTLFGN